MVVLIILLTIEILTFLVIKEHFFNISRLKFFVALSINTLLSLWLWYLLIKIFFYKGFYDNPENVWNHLCLTGMICAVVLPRFLLSLFHYTGKLIRIRKTGPTKWLTRTGMVISFVIFSVVTLGTLFGKFNFKTENISIRINGLDPRLNGLKIVQLSDMHLSGFYHHSEKMQKVIDKVNSYQPDLIFNTGDFISYGWREFDSFDTILVKARSKFGNYAITGNHDLGTYMPNSNLSEKESNTLIINELITKSGYRPLNDDHIVTDINGVKVELIGVTTGGRYPRIIHSDLKKAMAGIDTAGFKILLCHDPNQWEEDVRNKTDINLTLAGHTHGMQIGILTKKFRWSPIKHIYPHWNGLFSDGSQYLYVNRGLGVLAVPFRIWMPPEITVLTLVSE
ncbi:MAG: metallophosphoesterase [Bacteroidia bacterium]|nr:metallophosphoesterase [Bacteroidia bacterium]